MANWPSKAEKVLEELQVDGVTVVGVAKGPDRKPGLETLFLSDQSAAIILPEDSPALHLIQQVRDEAHRFAITGHRQRRARSRSAASGCCSSSGDCGRSRAPAWKIWRVCRELVESWPRRSMMRFIPRLPERP